MAPRQLMALLAMPASLRPLVLAAAASSSPSRLPSPSPALSSLPAVAARPFSTGRRLYAARGLKGTLTVGAFTAPRLPTRPWAAVPVERLLESPTDPDATLADELRHLFTRTPATFYHGTSNFYELKKNTQVPEICILGRSNAGKSTFVNALANRRGSTLARVSSKAGHTKAMNLYGFGPAPHPADLLAADPDAKKTEDMPKHCLYVVDMPGYGHKSLRTWGRHIDLYLQKRAAARGAVLLVDAEVGPKPNDFQALDMLCEHGVKTTIVLTKADKARHEDVLRDTCQRVLLYVRDLAERRPADRPWVWEPDFFVTAVGATRKETSPFSVDVARLAVARLAGMIEEKERDEPDETPSWSGNIVSFDQLEAQYAPAAARPTPASPAPPPSSRSSHDTPPPTPADDSSNWTPLERAARAQYQAQKTTTTPPPSRPPSSSVPPPRPTSSRPRQQTRAFHTQPERRHKGKPTSNREPPGWIDLEARSESEIESTGGRAHEREGDMEIDGEERLESETLHKIARPDHRELTKVLKTFIENLRKDLPPAPQPRLSPGVFGQPVPEEARLAEQQRVERLRRRQEEIFRPLQRSLERYGEGGRFLEPEPPKPLHRHRAGEIFDPLHKPRWWPPEVYAARMAERNADRERHHAIADNRRIREEVAEERRRHRREMEEADRQAQEAAQKRRGGRKARRPPGEDGGLGEDDPEPWRNGAEDFGFEEFENDDEVDDDERDDDDDDDGREALRTFHHTLKGKKAAAAQKSIEEGISRRNQKVRRRAANAAAAAANGPVDAFEAHFKNRR